MPYSKERYGTREQWKRYRRCVREVSAKPDGVNPYAVCRASVYGKGKRKRGKSGLKKVM